MKLKSINKRDGLRDAVARFKKIHTAYQRKSKASEKPNRGQGSQKNSMYPKHPGAFDTQSVPHNPRHRKFMGFYGKPQAVQGKSI